MGYLEVYVLISKHMGMNILIIPLKIDFKHKLHFGYMTCFAWFPSFGMFWDLFYDLGHGSFL